MAEVTVEQLQSVLTDRHDRLAELSDVVGWGVGLGIDGPVVDVFVSAPPSSDLLAELSRLFDRFEVVVQSGPAEAE